MRKFSCKLVSVFVIVSMITMIISYTAVANQINYSGKCGPNVFWELDSNGTLQIKGVGQMYCVRALDYEDIPWSKYRNEIKAVVIHDGVTSISSGAFRGCENLASVKMADSVKTIGTIAFSGCDSLTSIDFLSKGITKLVNGEFSSCDGLVNISIPNHITVLEGNVFSGCENLKEINIPESVVNRLAGGFYDVGGEDFLNINVDSRNLRNWSEEGVLFTNIPQNNTLRTYSGNALIKCPQGKSGHYIVPDGTAIISYASFQNCKKIESVTFPESVHVIENSAFDGCDSLKNIYFKGTEEEWNKIKNDGLEVDNITIQYVEENETDENNMISGVIGDCATWSFSDGTLYIDGFGEIYDFTSVNNKKMYRKIPWIHLMEDIKKVVVGPEIATISNLQFSHCSNLNEIVLLGENTNVGSTYFGKNSLYAKNQNNWRGDFLYVGGRVVGCDCVRVGDEFVIPEGTIGISEMIRLIGEKYIDIYIPSSRKIYIPSSVKYIEENAFSEFKHLEQFIVDENNPYFCSVDGVLYSKDMTKLIRCPADKEVDCFTILNTVTEIYDGAFYSCKNIKTIIIPDGVSHIKEATFSGTEEGLQDIYIPKSVKVIEGTAFTKYDRTFLVDLNGEARTTSKPLNIHYAGNYEDFEPIMIDRDQLDLFAASLETWEAIDAAVINIICEIQLSVNAQPLFLEQPVIIENGRTLVPLRILFEALGSSVEWNDKTQTVTAIKDGTKIEMTIGENEFYKNGSPVPLDVPAKLVNGRTFVPARAVAESFDCGVNWYEISQAVGIDCKFNL